MKKIIVILLIFLVVIFVFMGCQEVESNSETTSGKSMFILVEDTGYWKVVYHRESKVMYAVSYGSYNSGNFTLLVDQNGYEKGCKETAKEIINMFADRNYITEKDLINAIAEKYGVEAGGDR